MTIYEWIQIGILFVQLFHLGAFVWFGVYKVDSASKHIEEAIKGAMYQMNKEGIDPSGVKLRYVFHERFNREDFEGRFIYTGWKSPATQDESYLVEIRNEVGNGIQIFSQTNISVLNPKSFRFDNDRILLIPKELVPVDFDVVISCYYAEFPINLRSFKSVDKHSDWYPRK